MDLLNSALQLKNDATQRKSKTAKGNQIFDESEAGFHFIAFVPAKGRVWKFDGLERQPQNLGILPLAASSLRPLADVLKVNALVPIG
jgi:ubiquitin carboxyl-terminal hydrolase L5